MGRDGDRGSRGLGGTTEGDGLVRIKMCSSDKEGLAVRGVDDGGGGKDLNWGGEGDVGGGPKSDSYRAQGNA
jgi:hypothetical protein